MLRLTLLGPPALRRGDAPVPLPIKKSMALLVLLSRSGSALPRGRIADLLWPDLDEPAARRNLRRELARLREAGAGDAIDVDGDLLRAAPGLVNDATAFEQALAAGRAEDALDLWCGAPADGFALGDAPPFDEWLAAERDRLHERRRAALREALHAREAAGDIAAALVHSETLLADDPLQEQHHRDAMRLLAALGRREAALARYDACKAMLRDELGLSPMVETEALARSLREPGGASPVEPSRTPRPHAPLGRSREGGAGAWDGVPPNSAQPLARLPAELPFVGREAEIATLESAWSDGRAIVVEGEAGVGKSRLAIGFAAAHGPYALARCRSGDDGVPYAGFARALRALLGAETPALPAGLPAWVASEVARLVPELGAAPPPLRTDEERARFFEACARAWQALSADDFDAVVVDDWHLADAPSRILLAFVMRRRHEAGAGGAREIIVLRPDLDDEAREGLRALLASTAAAHVRLQTLSGDEVFDLVRRLSGAGEPKRFAGRLARATGGNAFFLAETLRHLVESGLLSIDADGAWQTPFDASTEDYREIPVPASVHEAVLTRARRLGPSAQRVLEAAALADEPFAPALLAPACALSELETVLAIESGVAAGLLQEHASGGFAFAHDLVQQALAGALSEQRRRLVHRRLALGAEAAAAPAATIAAHHEASGDAARAVAHRLAAGDDAQRMRALPDAVAQWRKALADGPTPAQAVRLHDRLSQAAFDRNDGSLAAEQADALGRLLDTAVLAPEERLPAAVTRATVLARAGRGAAALAVLDALPGEPAGALRVAALLARARAHDELGRSELAAHAVQAALAEPAATDADRVVLLDFAFLCDFNAGRNEAALVHADAATAQALRLGDGAGLARGHFRRGCVQLTMHALADAEVSFAAAAEAAGRLGMVRLERIALYNLTCVYGAQSRHADALVVARRGWDLQPPLEAGDFRIVYRLAVVDAYFGLGDIAAAWHEAAPAAREALAHADPRMRIGTASCIVELLGMIGQTALADELIGRVRAEDDGSLKAAADEMWVAAAQYELRRGDAAAAADFLARLDATGEAVVARVKVRDAQARAELALAQGDPSGALARLPGDDVVGMNGEMRMRGLALRVAAEARLGRLRPETLHAARSELESPPEHAIAHLELSWALAKASGGRAIEAHRTLVARLGDDLNGLKAAFDARWLVDDEAAAPRRP